MVLLCMEYMYIHMSLEYAKCVCALVRINIFHRIATIHNIFFFYLFTVTDIKKNVSFRLLCFFFLDSVCSLVSAEFGLVSL